MKKIRLTFIIAGTLIMASCGQHKQGEPAITQDAPDTTKETVMHLTPETDEVIKPITASFTDVDPKAAAGIKTIVDHYLHVKTALAADQQAAAAKGAGALQAAIGKLDQSLLTAAQKAAFDKIEGGVEDHAAQIAAPSATIETQRVHFITLSKNIYELAKSFGGGRTLYHDHCPMANNNQGAMWLSDVKEISNPYFGAQMLTCGSVEEVIQ